MKLLLALSLSLFAFSSMACTDFSGSYTDEFSDAYKVSQNACASFSVSSDTEIYSIMTDGKFRVTEENDEARISSAASFSGANLIVEGKIEYKVALPPEVPTELIPVRVVTVYSLDKLGNLVLVTTIYNSKNQIIEQETQTHQKI